MTIDSDVRVCVNCSSEIPRWKAKNERVCSAKCKFEFKEKKKATKRNSGSLLHACLANILDVPKPSCLCRKRLTDRQAQEMIENGEAVNFKSRLAEYAEGDALLVCGKNLKFPRAATIERPHVERLTNEHSSKSKSQSTEELEQAIAEDRASRTQEEALRTEIYHELTLAQRQRWVREIPWDEYDRAEREARGRCLFWFSDERTPGGVGIDVNPKSLASLVPIDLNHQEETEEIENVVSQVNEIDSEAENEISKTESNEICLDDVVAEETAREEEKEEEFV